MLKKKLTWVLILLLLIGISAGYLILNSNDKAMEQLVNMNYTEEEAKQIKDLGIANDVIAFGDSDLFETAFRQNKVTKDNYKRYLKANDSLPSGYSMEEVISNMDAMAAQGYTDEEGFSLMSRYGKDVTGQLFSYPKPEKLDTVLKLMDKGYSVNDIQKIWGGNFLRVMSQVQSVRN
ncbi:MAG: membrane dipeptidase [Erysipelotrichaceae bacterium]|nr:membrane dipeptidase [Erysipelotrichaceae bacterium]